MVLTRRRLFAAGIAALALLFVAVLVALPLVIRRVMEAQITQVTGRAVSIADVDLNIFTGRFGIAKFRLAQRSSTDPALEFERLEVRLAPTTLVTRNIRVREVILTAPTIHAARLGPDRFDFSDLLDLIPPPDPSKPPTTRTVMLERFVLSRGTVVARDDAVTPPAVWRLEGLNVDGAFLTTRAGARPGRLTVGGRISGTSLALAADAVDLTRTAVNARLTLDGFDLAQVGPYVPPTVAAFPTAGRATLDLRVATGRSAEGKLRVVLDGDARLDSLAVRQRGASADFLRLGGLAIGLKETAPLEGAITLSAVEVDTLDLSAVRDKQGRIDLLALAGGDQAPAAEAPPTRPPAVAAAPVPTPAPATAMPLKVAIDRIALARSRAAFKDETVTPITTLTLSDMSATITGLVWPGPKPFDVVASVGLPGAGRFTTKGSATLAPITADLAMSLRGGSIEPYRPYMPFKAQLAGSFHGDNRTRISLDRGKLTATSKGTSWIENFELRDPAGGTPPMRLERMEMAGIDFGWPTHAKVATITLRKPDVQVERAADGTIRLRELLTVDLGGGGSAPTESATPKPEPAKPAKPSPAPKKGGPVPAETQAKGGAVGFPMDIGTFIIEEGHIRFLDRSVKPAFSETVSRLALKIEGLSSTPGRRATLTSQAIVGGDAALEMRGELAPLGELYADISGELRDFRLTQVNPYADSMVAWIVDRGKLGVKFRYRIERNTIEATNEIVVENIHVSPSREDDEVKRRVGMPLGLIVALITDANDSLKVNLPISGGLDSWRADLGDAIWAVVKNVVVNVVAAPFRAIGRLFTGSDNKVEGLNVEPVIFPPGSDAVAPGMDKHLTAVADFLRRAPAIRLTLAPLPGAADEASLKGQELNARLQAIQRERELAEFPAAVASEFSERFPEVTKLPPPDEQLARLRERETLAPERLNELLARRVATVRDALTKTEGIPEARLRVEEAPATPAPAPAGEARVEFRIGQ